MIKIGNDFVKQLRVAGTDVKLAIYEEPLLGIRCVCGLYVYDSQSPITFRSSTLSDAHDWTFRKYSVWEASVTTKINGNNCSGDVYVKLELDSSRNWVLRMSPLKGTSTASTRVRLYRNYGLSTQTLEDDVSYVAEEITAYMQFVNPENFDTSYYNQPENETKLFAQLGYASPYLSEVHHALASYFTNGFPKLSTMVVSGSNASRISYTVKYKLL